LSVLRPITDAEYPIWLEKVIPGYAEDKVESGQWPAESALALSQKEFLELLPNGKDTKNNYLFTVLSVGGNAVGTLWFVAHERANRRIAYVYDITISPEHRRQGYAYQAFKAMEPEVARLGLRGIALHVFGHNKAAQALYLKLGYVTTNINMFKPVAGISGEFGGSN